VPKSILLSVLELLLKDHGGGAGEADAHLGDFIGFVLFEALVAGFVQVYSEAKE